MQLNRLGNQFLSNPDYNSNLFQNLNKKYIISKLTPTELSDIVSYKSLTVRIVKYKSAALI